MCISWWDYQTGELTAAAEHEEQPSQAFVNAKLVIFEIVLALKVSVGTKTKAIENPIFGQFAITNVAVLDWIC